ncbi:MULTISPECIES: sensor histidine kinase [unclassified Bradyrhizobium]|uniref:HWE histidine kinase domain-containing protein n=1 Tax=unclassified Bradyrhizobium TaxID=2631580 RepID=UPI001FFAA57B|nr:MULTISPECIES: sensor histidine kinase [unclassified Bradyrhizobium]
MNALSEADQRMREVENENDVLRDLLLKAGVEANAHVAAAKLQTVLIGELHHRVKNMLAIASAIAAQSLRDASSIDAAAKTIAERMSALGVSHDLLIQQSWTGAGCRTLIENAIKAFQTKGFEQFTIEGNNVAVSSGPAVALSMIIHELSTNALKYGALSVAEGRSPSLGRLTRKTNAFILNGANAVDRRLSNQPKRILVAVSFRRLCPVSLKAKLDCCSSQPESFATSTFP